MAGAGFIRRYTYFPGVEELTAIEGVVIVDARSPGPISGASYGVVAVVGEAANMSHCCTVSSAGVVQSSISPAEVYGGSDLVDKIGTIDPLLGKFGGDMGNLFVELRNKRFTRLVVVPVDLVRPTTGSQYAIRLWRQLPTNRTATDPTPIFPVTATRISAGFTFTSGSNRAVLAQDVDFSGKVAKSSGVDGTTATVVGGTTRVITRAAGSFIADNVVVGDLVVPGSLNATAATQNAICAAAGTCRVTAVDAGGLAITVQKLDGSAFTDTTDWMIGTALAFRVHAATDGDSGIGALATASAYTVLARPRVGTIAATTALTPSPVPTAASGTFWDVASGLTGMAHPTGALTYDAAVHADNLATTSLLRARYGEAIDALLNDDTPMNEVSFVISARKDATIQSYLRAHALIASSRGMSRTALISPTLTTLTKAAVLGSAAPGVGGAGGAVRSDRLTYSWPGCRTFIPELVGTTVACSDSTTTDDGVIDVTMDTWLACLLSNLQPELNPGQAADPVPTVFSPIIGYQRGCPTLDMSDYILFKQYGIAALRMDRVVGPIIQSGVTTSLTSGETNINRRRFADFVQDSLAARYNQMSKMLGRQGVKDAMLSETVAFFDDLLSESNPDLQRIDSYLVDDKSLNTPSLSSQGIHIIKSKVRMLQTLDTVVAATEIGPSTVTTSVT